ncbi:hypothetical protein BS47DRAFT_1400330 [Hydnum rufescens UP504]|uniref:CxC1-like cysteine cluster associated with KDZ transposases domain-containing protein n=1 Tax=Hydnum rufescens UP504 TaxID=1448309 RepID=A0A9P6DNQ4_9AGAM|nr:hypothetical protein BS47DRAFT_1400330 [Hydnum rufescens UP504]
MAPSIPASARDIADSPLPSLETSVLPRFPPDPPLTRSEYFSWDHVDVQYAAEMSQSKIQVMKDKRSQHALSLGGASQTSWQKSPIVLQYVDVGTSTLRVLCVSMERLEEVVLTVCPCHLAAIQLVERGFFPCAPLFPTLAVSLNMLEFVASLFLHTAPNERALATTLVEYLKARGYEFATGDSFRRRFVNALAHYQVLVWLVRAEITRIVQDDKRGLISELDERTPVHEQGYVNVQSDPKLFANSTPANASVNAPATVLTHVSADLPPDSFIAADEDRVKASTQYFEDTGVIALLCRHDIPLAVASMWTAGEKQFYVFALLETVLKHVPSHWRIGALYDIGCQMDQTLKKWRFMPEWLPFLEWGVSIFHAYGHQWHASSGIILANQSSGDSQMAKGVSGFGVEHIDDGKRMGMGKWLQGRIDRLQHRLEEAEMKLGDHSPSYLMSSSKPNENITANLFHASLRRKRGNLKDLIAEGNDLVQDDTTAAMKPSWRLETMINKKTNELRLTDRASASELNRLKKDKWVNIQLNLRALREQLLKKLRARKGRGGIRRDAYILPMLTMDGLYKLDVDQDIWEDSRGDIADFPDGVVPPWLADPSVKEGILISQEVQLPAGA